MPSPKYHKLSLLGRKPVTALSQRPQGYADGGPVIEGPGFEPVTAYDPYTRVYPRTPDSVLPYDLEFSRQYNPYGGDFSMYGQTGYGNPLFGMWNFFDDKLNKVYPPPITPPEPGAGPNTPSGPPPGPLEYSRVGESDGQGGGMPPGGMGTGDWWGDLAGLPAALGFGTPQAAPQYNQDYLSPPENTVPGQMPSLPGPAPSLAAQQPETDYMATAPTPQNTTPNVAPAVAAGFASVAPTGQVAMNAPVGPPTGLFGGLMSVGNLEAAELGRQAVNNGVLESLATAIQNGHPVGQMMADLEAELNAATYAEKVNAAFNVANSLPSFVSPQDLAELAAVGVPSFASSFGKGVMSAEATPEAMGTLNTADQPSMQAFADAQQNKSTGMYAAADAANAVGRAVDFGGMVAAAKGQIDGLKGAVGSLNAPDMGEYQRGEVVSDLEQQTAPTPTDLGYSGPMAAAAYAAQQTQNWGEMPSYSAPTSPTGEQVAAPEQEASLGPEYNDENMIGGLFNPATFMGAYFETTNQQQVGTVSADIASRALSNYHGEFGAPAVGKASGVMDPVTGKEFTEIGLGQAINEGRIGIDSGRPDSNPPGAPEDKSPSDTTAAGPTADNVGTTGGGGGQPGGGPAGSDPSPSSGPGSGDFGSGPDSGGWGAAGGRVSRLSKRPPPGWRGDDSGLDDQYNRDTSGQDTIGIKDHMLDWEFERDGNPLNGPRQPFPPIRRRPYGIGQYANGGDVRSQAESVRKMGRRGDSVLAHISPQEARAMDAMQGGPSFNPRTGQREYFGLGDIGDFFEDAAQTIVPIAGGIIGGYFGGPLGAGLGSAFGTAVVGGSLEDSLMSGIFSGASAYAIPKITEGLGFGGSGLTSGLMGGGDGGGSDYASVGEGIMGGDAPQAPPSGLGGLLNTISSPMSLAALGGGALLGGVTGGPDYGGEESNQQQQPLTLPEQPWRYGTLGPRQFQGYGGDYSTYGQQGGDPSAQYFDVVNPGVRFAEGGVAGPGTGQSDGIPAMLSDGEYILPADIVGFFGSGSNDAGAEKFDALIQNVRKHARSRPPSSLPPKPRGLSSYMVQR